MSLFSRIRQIVRNSVVHTAILFALSMPVAGMCQENVDALPDRVVEVEGVSEYRLSNGCRVVVYPDASAQVLTVNMTVLVGSRHEGYGETGMAHLLEHMLFKGTAKHLNVKEELKQRGASDMNGTTWYDRTNFYETLPATSENLEWAIAMEADRLVNCPIRAEDLNSEMTVVRSEFEMNENSPQQILMQRMNASAFEWHNYGKTVIGSRADIEKVPASSLRRFYQKYYRPDNVVLIVTGKVDEKEVLSFAVRHFGSLSNPDTMLEPTYTQEPIQDGERTTFLRRVGGTPVVGSVYHIPPAAHEDYPAVKVLSEILAAEPTGVLYRELVYTNQASQVSAYAMECREPGMMVTLVVSKDADTTESEVIKLSKQLSDFMESDLLSELSPEMLEQAKAKLSKNYDDSFFNSKNFAMTLSDWSAYGDWRLFFVTRDRIQKVSLDDVKRVAGEYLRASNRTSGIYLPTEKPHRSTVPMSSDIETLVGNYKSARSTVSVESAFEPKPSEIQKRLLQGKLDSGIPYSLLPKPTRGDVFHLQLSLDFGTPANFNTREMINAVTILGPAMMLGTEKLNREQIDQLQTKYKTQINIMSEPGMLQVNLEGRKEFLAETLDLVRDLLRNPAFPDEEFGQFKSKQLSELSQMKNSPELTAQLSIGRALHPVESSDFQYVPTYQEMFADLRKAKSESLKKAHSLLSGSRGYVSVVGSFDKDETLKKLNEIVANWNPEAEFVRLEKKVYSPKKETIELKLRDQASAMYLRGLSLNANYKDDDFEALTIATDILGGPSLDCRLAKRVRDKKGLSYQIGCQFGTGEFDNAGQFMIYAIMNPANKTALVNAVDEVLETVKKDGFTEEELQASITTYEKQTEAYLSDDASLIGVVQHYGRRGVGLDYLARRIDRVRGLKLEQVNAAARKLLSADAITVLAGDFEEATKEDKE